MSRKYSFSVSKEEGATSHDVAIVLPDTFTAAQTKNLVEEGLKSVRIKVQGTLRRALSKDKPVKPGVEMNALAQSAFDAVINGSRVEVRPTVDATAMKLTREQIDLMTADGYTVINIPAALAKK